MPFQTTRDVLSLRLPTTTTLLLHGTAKYWRDPALELQILPLAST